MTNSPLVQLQREGAVMILELHRPEALNALNVELANAVLSAVRAIERERGVRAVVLCAAGRAFGVGGDLQAMQSGEASDVARRLIEPLHEAVRCLAQMDAPVIAALHGAVAGGSLSLALACDLAIAAEGTRFNLAYASVGASCDVNGSWALPRIVGLRKAMEIALLSDTIDATEALRLGLVNRVVPEDALRQEALALAQRLVEGPTLAYGRLKRLLRSSFDRDLSQQLDEERDAFIASSKTRDFAEGIQAFLEKRTARFNGT
ncbi:enoyl-CoA hydratase [Rugamonas sp. FT82W]|uniref:Enoyl-CoA hydratase n=2 Tax=Duganella vulcania TaxID=2692166 RepID=A0A845G157_9BURK|nr:enoyl-CoA hydratase [Duganella vulcania]